MLRGEAEARQRIADDEQRFVLEVAQTDTHACEHKARLLEIQYEAAREEAREASELRRLATEASAGRWEAERREAETSFDATDRVRRMESRLVRLHNGLEAVYRKQVKEAHIAAYENARAALDESTRNLLERAERLEQEKEDLAARFSVTLEVATRFEPELGRTKAELELARQAEERMAERMVRADKQLLAAEAAAKAAEREREDRRVENAELVAEVVALRSELQKVKEATARKVSAEKSRAAMWRDQAMTFHPVARLGDDGIIALDCVGTDFDLGPPDNGALELGALDDIQYSEASELARVEAAVQPPRAVTSHRANAAARSNQEASRLDLRWSELMRPSSAEAQRRRLQSMRAEMGLSASYQSLGQRSDQSDPNGALLEEMSIEVFDRTSGFHVHEEDVGNDASPSEPNMGSVAGSQAEIEFVQPVDTPLMRRSLMSASTPPQPSMPTSHHGPRMPEESEIWKSAPGQVHTLARPSSQPSLANRRGTSTSPLRNRPATVSSLPVQVGIANRGAQSNRPRSLSRPASAAMLHRPLSPNRMACNATASRSQGGFRGRPASATLLDAGRSSRTPHARRPSTSSPGYNFGQLDSPMAWFSNGPSHVSNRGVATAANRRTTRPHSACPCQNSASSSSPGLPQRPSTAPQPLAPEGLLTGSNAPLWQQALTKHSSAVRGGGWNKVAQQAGRQRQHRFVVTPATVTAKSGSAVWSLTPSSQTGPSPHGRRSRSRR